MKPLPPPTPDAKAPTASDPERWVDDYGDYLYACAMVRLRDSALAQDVVQETFLAALKSQSSYAGQSAERAWLTGILKHKIYDHYRKAARETSFTDLEFYRDQEAAQFVSTGLHKDAWLAAQAPADWSQPEESCQRDEFWNTLHHCAGKLPKHVSRAFLLREVDGVSTKEICSLLAITQNNLWVMLHRARMALRRCLEKNWFTQAK